MRERVQTNVTMTKDKNNQCRIGLFEKKLKNSEEIDVERMVFS
jgi:hypothetical protein